MGDGPFLRPAHEKVGIVKVPYVKLMLGGSGVDGGSQDAEIATESTAQAISALADSVANLTAMLAANMPRVTATKQIPVSIEGGSVGISTNQTLATVTNLAQAGATPLNGPSLNACGLPTIYNYIQVS